MCKLFGHPMPSDLIPSLEKIANHSFVEDIKSEKGFHLRGNLRGIEMGGMNTSNSTVKLKCSSDFGGQYIIITIKPDSYNEISKYINKLNKKYF